MVRDNGRCDSLLSGVGCTISVISGLSSPLNLIRRGRTWSTGVLPPFVVEGLFWAKAPEHNPAVANTNADAKGRRESGIHDVPTSRKESFERKPGLLSKPVLVG